MPTRKEQLLQMLRTNPSGFFNDVDKNINSYPLTRKADDLKNALRDIKGKEKMLREAGIDPNSVPEYTSRLSQILQFPNPTNAASQLGSYDPSKERDVAKTSDIAKEYGYSTGGGGIDITQSPENVAFKDSAAYKGLTSEQKEFVDMAFNLIEVGGENEARMFSEAIKQAKAIADPYFKAQLSLAQAEIAGGIAEMNLDYDTKREIIQRTKDQLLEDVKISKDFLSVEQQSEIARMTKDLDRDLLAVGDAAAEKGLTFATGYRSRVGAQARKREQFQDVAQSRQRMYNLKINELKLRADRGDTTAQQQLEALQTGKGLALERIGRGAEALIGTAGLTRTTEEGYKPVGGVIGKLEEEKRKSTIADVGAYVELQKGFL